MTCSSFGRRRLAPQSNMPRCWSLLTHAEPTGKAGAAPGAHKVESCHRRHRQLLRACVCVLAWQAAKPSGGSRPSSRAAQSGGNKPPSKAKLALGFEQAHGLGLGLGLGSGSGLVRAGARAAHGQCTAWVLRAHRVCLARAPLTRPAPPAQFLEVLYDISARKYGRAAEARSLALPNGRRGLPLLLSEHLLPLVQRGAGGANASGGDTGGGGAEGGGGAAQRLDDEARALLEINTATLRSIFAHYCRCAPRARMRARVRIVRRAWGAVTCGPVRAPLRVRSAAAARYCCPAATRTYRMCTRHANATHTPRTRDAHATRVLPQPCHTRVPQPGPTGDAARRRPLWAESVARARSRRAAPPRRPARLRRGGRRCGGG